MKLNHEFKAVRKGKVYAQQDVRVIKGNYGIYAIDWVLSDIDVLRRTSFRFWSKVAPKDNNGCMNWSASVISEGYGTFKVSKKGLAASVMAHRMAYALGTGSHPSGSLVLHSCGNRKCCNPKHLRLGDHFDNWDDRRKADSLRAEQKLHTPRSVGLSQ